MSRLGLTRAVVAALAGKIWGTFSGLVTLALLSTFLAPEAQGYYYTFLSLVALQTFFDLSFSSVILNFTSHEWSGLRLTDDGRVSGDPAASARLTSIMRFSVRWYSALAILFAVFVGAGGAAFLTKKHAADIAWQWPWFFLIGIAGLQFFLLPMQSILEGCNQIARVSTIRLIASVASSAAFWLALTFHLGLWSVGVGFFTNWAVQVVLGLRIYWPFYRSVYEGARSEGFDWKREMLPLQWRLAVAGISGYFATSYFVPIIFWYWGPVAAGQMGMGWSIMVAAQAVSLTWLYVYTPTFGALIARRDFGALDALFYRIMFTSWGVLLFLGFAAWALIKTLNTIGHPFAARCMSPFQLGLFLGAALLMHFPQCQAAYLRAHKKEPLLLSSVVSSALTGGLAWWYGKKFGIAGVGGAYLAAIGLVMMPFVSFVWWRRRREWHA